MPEDLEARIVALEKRVQVLNDIEEIKKLQRAYGYYLEHVMVDEIVDCFADGPGVYMYWLEIRTWAGKEGVRQAFSCFPKSPEMLHMAMQCSGIVDVDPDGVRAMGRWYGWNAVASPVPGSGALVAHHNEVPFYEIEYVKQDGTWKIKVMAVGMVYVINEPVDNIVAPEKRARPGATQDMSMPPEMMPAANEALSIRTRYPNGYILPFHYRHPVTGKDTYQHPPTGRIYKIGRPDEWIKTNPVGAIEA